MAIKIMFLQRVRGNERPRVTEPLTGPLWAVKYQWFGETITKPPFHLFCCDSPLHYLRHVHPYTTPNIYTQHQPKYPYLPHLTEHFKLATVL